jgi:hypothetical protein
MCSEGKPVTGAVIVEKATCFYTAIKIADRCTVYEGWL